MTNAPFITCGKTRLLNVPHAAEVIREVWDEDCYRLNEIPDGSIILDVGAFYGEFGLICHVNKGCTVWAFEPSEENCDVLCLNKNLNDVKGQFIPHRYAISSDETFKAFKYRPEHPAGSMVVDEEFPLVASHKLSSELREVIMFYGNEFPIVVKLDCEGSERSIFEDDPDWIPMVNIVTMEWHNHDGDFYAAILEKHGFDVQLEGGGPKPRPAWNKSIGGGYLFAKRRNS